MGMVFYYVVGVLVGLALLVAQKRLRQKRPCWFYGHDAKYLALRTVTVIRGGTPGGRPLLCNGDGTHNHKIGATLYEVRWSCRRCPTLGEECLGSGQAWKIEHEKLVLDEKKWANWDRESSS